MIHSLKINFEIPVSSEITLPRFVNMFVLEGKVLHLIDTGVKSGYLQIESFIRSLGKEIQDVRTILLTHSHPDHIGCAKLIKEKSGCRVIAPKAEAGWIENTDLQFRKRPVPGFLQLVEGPVNIDQTVNGFQRIIPEPDIDIEVIPVPGHSAGSTAYYLESRKVLFSGDAVLLPGEIPIFENVTDYLSSLETIKNLEVHTMYSAWDIPRNAKEIPVILEKSKKYILRIQDAVNKVVPRFKGEFSMEFCKAVLRELGQNEEIANPLLLKSFQACLQ